MKFKKAFAWILAVAMIISLMPSMAFAATTNTVISVPTVATDSNFGSDVLISLKNTSGSPITAGTIKIGLENATFEKASGAALGDPGADVDDYIVLSTTTSGIAANDFVLTGDSLSDDSAMITFSGQSVADGQYMYLIIDGATIKSGTEAGEVKLSIDAMDSMITGNTYVIAIAGTGRTVAEVTGAVSTVPRGQITSNAKIEITETSINALTGADKEVIKMTLPKDCAWVGATVAGGLLSGNGDLTVSNSIPANSDFSNSANGLYVDSANTRIAYLVVGINTDSAKRDILTIVPEYTIGKDTPQGDITVEISGYKAYAGSATSTKTVSDASGLVVNVYGEESVTVSTVDEEKLPQAIAGNLQDVKEKNFTVKVTLTENMKGALQAGRYVDFDFPEQVQIKGSATDLKYVVSKNTSASTTAFNSSNAKYIELENSLNGDASGFSFLVPDSNDNNYATVTGWNSNQKNTITFEIPVTVEAGYEGDIICTVSGAKAGVDETELVVGTVIVPITISAETTDIKTGIQSQAVADITITENIPGYLSDAKNENILQVGIDSLGLLAGMSIAKVENVEVTEGNLELGKISVTSSGSAISVVEGDYIKIPIQSSSTKESTIVVSGVTVNLNRTLPEGGYTLLAGGSAVVDNTAYNDGDFSDVAASLENYVNITTPADAGTDMTSKFVIGETSFTVNGVTYEMDAAAYIDDNDRTMVPIRYFAMACGISEDDISWDQAAQTATINAPNGVIKVTMGSNVIWVSNGNNVQMDTVPVNDNGRIYVPVRFLSNALGFSVEWDNDARTVTIYNA